MTCTKGLEITVLKSGAGYYIGTQDIDTDLGITVPNCRLSQQYYQTEAEAWYAFKECTFSSREESLENLYCNNGQGCF